MAKKTYQVVSPIRRDGKDCAVGDQVELEDKDAGDLLAVKAIEPAAATSDVPAGKRKAHRSN